MTRRRQRKVHLRSPRLLGAAVCGVDIQRDRQGQWNATAALEEVTCATCRIYAKNHPERFEREP